eukprot:551108_1
MSLTKDQFNDAELTSFAIEIIKDLYTKPHVDPHDSFICELAEEIEKELMANVDPLTSQASSSFYTDPSIYLASNTSVSTVSHHHNDLLQAAHVPPINIPYKSLSAPRPQIISCCQLSSNDSFNHALPSLPASPVHSPKCKALYITFEGDRKRAATYSKGKQRNQLSPKHTHNQRRRHFKSPFHPPPRPQTPVSRKHVQTSIATNAKSMKSDITSCISPRCRQTANRNCAIPNFSEMKDVVAIRVTRKTIPQAKQNDNKRRERSNGLIYNEKRDMRYRSRSNKQVRSKLNRQRARNNARKIRSNSVHANATSPISAVTNAAGVGNGFVFMKAYK